jgi:hypothetical protein
MANPTEAPHGVTMQSDRPGDFPTVVDEAASSPRWIPLAGLALVLVALLFAAYRAGQSEQTDEIVPEGDAAAAAAAEEQKVEEPTPAPAPTPPPAVAPPPPVPIPAAAAQPHTG